MTKNGIDVSEWQGVIDWEAVKASGKVDFAILRAGLGRYSSQIDKQFERNYAECKRLGIPCGAYWYGYATSKNEATEEANACLDILDGKKFDYPVYYDVEEQCMLNSGNVDDIIYTFCKALETSGFYAGLYMSRCPLNAHVSTSVRNRFTLWVAEYGPKCNYNGTYGMWQKSSEGVIPGIEGNVDLNECYYDYPRIINGESEPQKKSMKVTIEYDDHIFSGLLEER